MHNKFMRLGLGSAFAWNSSWWCADHAQWAGICQPGEKWCWPKLPRDRRECAQPQLDAAKNPSVVVAVGLLQPLSLERGIKLCLVWIVSCLVPNGTERGRNLDVSSAECLSQATGLSARKLEESGDWEAPSRGQRGLRNKEEREKPAMWSLVLISLTPGIVS